jgi:hypothetical protein
MYNMYSLVRTELVGSKMSQAFCRNLSLCCAQAGWHFSG